MKSQYVVPANKPWKTTKHDWWHYRWLEGRANLGACRTARLLHKDVLKHDNIELWKEQIALAEKSIAKYQRLIDEAVSEGWTSIDTSSD